MKAKVRAWQVNFKRYLCVHSIEFDKNGEVYSVTVDNTANGKYSVIPTYSIYLVNSKEFSLSDLILEWFTGLTDKNGKEIYEGDKCTFSALHGDVVTIIYDVDRCKFSLEARCPDDSMGLTIFNKMELELIGNIHDNPELS